MSLSTTCGVAVTTEYHDAAGTKSKWDIANDIQTSWNNYLSYSISTSTLTPFVDLSGYSINDIYEAKSACQDWINNNESSWLNDYDSIIVRDAGEGFANPAGTAALGMPTTGHASENFAAGANTTNCVAYDSISPSSHLYTHEVGHLYGGVHQDHDHYGAWEHTIMGNSGYSTCSGGSSDWRTRTNHWNSCVIDKIEGYMDYWNMQNNAFE